MIRGLDEELRAHKYSHVERERRFLVDPERMPPLDTCRAILIEDRYIAHSRFRLRRMIDLASGRTVLKLSKKYDVADVRARPMVTAYLSEEEHALFAALPAHPLEKRRYTVSDDGFGIDVFAGPLAGLILAEIEQTDDASLAAISPPQWAIREVTDNPVYQGGNLASLDRVRAEALIA